MKTIAHDPPETLLADGKRVRCDGGGGALGHPVVYYNMGAAEDIECQYCGRRYVLRGSARARALGLA